MRQVACRNVAAWARLPPDMTAAPISASSATDAPGPGARRRGLRTPGSRGGVVGLVVLTVLAGLLAIQVGRQVYANWEIGQRAAAMEAQIAEVEAQNARLQAELDYLESDAYISAEARRLTNVGATGEQVLIIPRGAEAPLPDELTEVEPPKPMLEQWWEVFFGPSR